VPGLSHHKHIITAISNHAADHGRFIADGASIYAAHCSTTGEAKVALAVAACRMIVVLTFARVGVRDGNQWRKGRTHPCQEKYKIFWYLITQCYRRTNVKPSGCANIFVN